MLDVTKLTLKQMMELRHKLNQAIEGIEKTAKADLLDGKVVKGFSLRIGRKTRKVVNEVTFAHALSSHLDYSELYSAKMLGLPAIEKALKAKDMNADEVSAILEPHVLVSTSAPTLQYHGEENV